MSKYAIVFEVDGAFMKSAVLNYDGQVYPGTTAIYPSNSNLSKQAFIAHIVDLIKQQTGRILDKTGQIYGVGFAFPGPFDYEKGISYIKGLNKYEQLYGVHLHDELMRQLQMDEIFIAQQAAEFRMVFENDASLFALGESLSGRARFYDRSICVLIGTGAGSAFLDRGSIVKDRMDVPPNGWIYDKAFGEGIIDDYISKRGLLHLAGEYGMDVSDMQVKELAELARHGDSTAIQVFHQFGRNIGTALNDFIDLFRPEAIVLGGQMSKSFDLFHAGLLEAIKDKSLQIENSNHTSDSIFAGISQLLHMNAVQFSSRK